MARRSSIAAYASAASASGSSRSNTRPGWIAPVRGYIEELLPDVRSGAIQPGRVFDLELPLAEAAEAYAAMDERRATKVLLRP